MKKAGKIALTVISFLSFLSIVFWAGLYYVGGLSYMYPSPNMIKQICCFCAVGAIALVVLILLIRLLFKEKAKKFVKIISVVLLIAFILASAYGSLIGWLTNFVLGPNGCSYTEDIANYGKYDIPLSCSHFPESITEEMTVVDFAYFYKYIDTTQADLYLELKFADAATMEKYLTAAINSFADKDTITHQNPYNEKYTDVIGHRLALYSQDGKFSAYIKFEGSENYRYVNMDYSSITYSYEELTIIYNNTSIGSDIEVGNNPDRGEYYPKFLERFGVEWDPDNTFMLKYIEE